ncbi:MAG: glycosyltransferase family 2 protein [Burkholderiales bacterium]
MNPVDSILALQWLFLLYFIGINSGYILLNLLSIRTLRSYMEAENLDDMPRFYSGYEPPVSLLVPVYNDENRIADSVRSLLQLDYPEYEIIVINDGSTDRTFAALEREFSLVAFPEAYWQRLHGKGVRAIFRSTAHPNLRVIEKENGGKADALNAGINASRYPLFCAMDQDSVLRSDSLRRLAQPFVENPDTVAVGSMVRIANGCAMERGFISAIGLPASRLALLQIVEQLRTQLFGRLGWSLFNAVLIISDSFTLFRKESVVEAGGYHTGAIDEDMELIVRLHRLQRLRGARYQIAYLPDTLCWATVPETLSLLRKRRSRWQHGLADSLALNLPLLFHRNGGTVSWLAFPFIMVLEWLGPVIEVAAYILMLAGFALGVVSVPALVIFLLVAIGFGMLLSVSSLALEELSFHLYPRPRQLALLLLVAFLENLGYRQLVALWRVGGIMQRLGSSLRGKTVVLREAHA